MKLRIARKLTRRAGLGGLVIGPQHRRAAARYLRWRHRPRAHPCAAYAGHYVLNRDGQPRLFTGDLLDWAVLFSVWRPIEHDRRGDRWISTIFLALDHNYGQGEPLLFETMAFEGRESIAQRRYPTRHDAIVGHAALAASLGIR